jgi:hypothetical protein
MLDAGTLERLVYLRLMLREAQLRAEDRTHAGRHTAAVQLDGVCEHAMMLAVGQLQQAPGRSFHANYQALRNALGSTWTADGWSGVDRLHGTRTEAQHRGTVPDQAEFTRWSADAERFVNSLVAAAFGVDLQTVSTAQAVETDAVREVLERAEDELAAGNFAASARASADALAEARRRWEAQRRDALGPGKSRPMPMQDLTADYVRDAVERMDDLADVATFASDVGEYVWLRSVERVLWQDVPVTRDDAERALAFVVGWTLRWEAFSHRYTMDRPGLYRRSRRPQTTNDPLARVRIGSVVGSVPERRSPEEARIPALAVTLVDLPEHGHQAWLELFRESFAKGWSASSLNKEDERRGAPWTDDEGELTAPVAGEQEATELIDIIKAAIADAQAAWEQALQAAAGAQVDTAQLQREFAATMSTVLFEGQPLVTAVDVESYRVGRGIGTPAVAVKLALRLDGDQYLRHRFWQELHATGQLGPGQNAPLDLHDNILTAPGAMAASDVRDVLATAANAVEAEREETRAAQQKDDELRLAVETAARSRAGS